MTRGYEMFGLELGWEEERRLGDSRKNKQPMTYVEATGGGTQKNGDSEKDRHRGPAFLRPGQHGGNVDRKWGSNCNVTTL